MEVHTMGKCIMLGLSSNIGHQDAVALAKSHNRHSPLNQMYILTMAKAYYETFARKCIALHVSPPKRNACVVCVCVCVYVLTACIQYSSLHLFPSPLCSTLPKVNLSLLVCIGIHSYLPLTTQLTVYPSNHHSADSLLIQSPLSWLSIDPITTQLIVYSSNHDSADCQ